MSNLTVFTKKFNVLHILFCVFHISCLYAKDLDVMNLNISWCRLGASSLWSDLWACFLSYRRRLCVTCGDSVMLPLSRGEGTTVFFRNNRGLFLYGLAAEGIIQTSGVLQYKSGKLTAYYGSNLHFPYYEWS